LTVTGDDLIALLPLLILAAASVLILLQIAFYRSHLITALVAMDGFALAFLSIPFVADEVPRQVTPLLILDYYSYFYMGLILAAGFFVSALSYGYLQRRDLNREEYYLLLVLAALGAGVMAASSHFASLFVGLELLSISLYPLVGYILWNRRCIEAALKYLILASAATAFLLLGMALIYAQGGTLDLQEAFREGDRVILQLTGLSLIIIAVGFKLAVVPFHMWTPDVYQGAPAPVTAFVATASKGAMFAVLLRYFIQVKPEDESMVWMVFAIIAILSIVLGNLLALLQTNVKRLLAYSSIAHLGYLLVAFLAGGANGATAVAYYLAAYVVTTLGTFGIITVLSGPDREAENLVDFRGLYWRRPWLAAAFTAMLLSLGGIPLTAGFVGKFYVVLAGVGTAQWFLVFSLVLGSAIGIYYYLRVIVQMYLPRAQEDGETAGGDQLPAPAFSTGDGLVLAALVFLLIWLGVYPGPFLRIIRATVETLVQQ